MLDSTSPEFLNGFQEAWGLFKSRCVGLNVWDAVHNQHAIISKAGVSDFDARRALMPVWIGCLKWLEEGNDRQKWDFEKMKPKSCTDNGAFEVSPIEVKRQMTVHQMLMEHKAREIFEGRSGKTRAGAIESNNGLSVAGQSFSLKYPNATGGRRADIEWVVDNLFMYRRYLEEKQETKRIQVLETAPTMAAVSWMETAASNPNAFMKEVPKLLPDDKGQNEEEKASEVMISQVLADMEQQFKVTCPTCSSKF